jgi:SAM-dependent methyltransferase
MGLTLLLWAGGLAAALALLYWLVVIAEGAYLGSWAVRLIYHYGSRVYDQVRAPSQTDDARVLLPLLRGAVAHVQRPRVLDVATGTGRVPLLLAADAGFAGSIDAIDLTEAMLERARARQAASNPAAPITWRRGEASRLSWPAAAFDLVCCLEALEYFPRPRRALDEMARVLRPGGTLVVSKVPDVWARLMPGRALTQQEMRRALTRAGLDQIAFRPWQPGHYELVTARKRAAE